MDIKTKYKIGDEVFIIREDKIEKANIKNFRLEDNEEPLEKRLRYVLTSPQIEEINQSRSLLMWYYSGNVRKESEIFETIDDLLKYLKDEYNRQS